MAKSADESGDPAAPAGLFDFSIGYNGCIGEYTLRSEEYFYNTLTLAEAGYLNDFGAYGKVYLKVGGGETHEVTYTGTSGLERYTKDFYVSPGYNHVIMSIRCAEIVGY